MATMESTVYISIENSGVRNSIAIISINFVGNKVIPLRYQKFNDLLRDCIEVAIAILKKVDIAKIISEKGKLY